MSTTDTAAVAKLKRELTTFTGTMFWYKHSLFREFHYTDGVKYLAEEAECYWLIDRIFGLQYEQKAIRGEAFQVWELILNEDTTAVLNCGDGNNNNVHTDILSFTDFPLPEIRLFLIDGILLLPSEY